MRCVNRILARRFLALATDKPCDAKALADDEEMNRNGAVAHCRATRGSP